MNLTWSGGINLSAIGIQMTAGVLFVKKIHKGEKRSRIRDESHETSEKLGRRAGSPGKQQQQMFFALIIVTCI